MGDEDLNYTFYGEQLEEIDEDEVRRKPIPIEDQIVLDKNGKRRFHGAFTGGFAAGYWNTVGSEEGWKPSTFQSSRTEKAQKREQRPQDFMDDEDQEEFGIAPRVLRAKQEFGAVSREPKRVYGDTLGVAKILKPIKERIGERMLRNMGWRRGEGVGPKLSREERKEQRTRRKQEGKKVYGCALGPVAAQISHEDSDTSDSDVETMYPPDDIPDCLANPKSDTFGLGYSGLDRRPVLSGSGHINLFEPSVTNMPRAGVSGFRGQAFGVGAFEVEDTDIYQTDDMSNYDFALESASERKRKQRWDRENQKKQKVDTEDCIPGFRLSAQPMATVKVFPPPVLPKNYTPKHQSHKSRFSEPTVEPNDQHKLLGLGRHDMTAEERSVLIGEAKARTAKPSEPVVDTQPLTVQPVPEDFTVEPAVLKEGQLNPFTHDANKQMRYRQFLTLAKEGRKEDLYKLQPKTMTEWERGRELREFDTASALFKSGPISDRFVSSATLLGNDELPTLEAPKVEATVQAAKMKLFGKLTRTREPWQPCSLLCKRFNVPEPNSGLAPVKRKATFSVFDFLSAAPQNAAPQNVAPVISEPPENQPEASTEQAGSSKDVTVTSIESSVTVEVPSSSQPPMELPQPNELDKAEEEVINLDFYKAIFLSSSEDEAEGDDLPVPPPNLQVAPVATKPKEPELPKIPPVETILERRPRSPPRGVFANLDQVMTPAVDPVVPELPPDMYGPSLPTQIPVKIQEAKAPTRIEFHSSNKTHWVEKTQEKKKKKKHSKDPSSRSKHISRKSLKKNRSPELVDLSSSSSREKRSRSDQSSSSKHFFVPRRRSVEMREVPELVDLCSPSSQGIDKYKEKRKHSKGHSSNGGKHKKHHKEKKLKKKKKETKKNKKESKRRKSSSTNSSSN